MCVCVCVCERERERSMVGGGGGRQNPIIFIRIEYNSLEHWHQVCQMLNFYHLAHQKLKSLLHEMCHMPKK